MYLFRDATGVVQQPTVTVLLLTSMYVSHRKMKDAFTMNKKVRTVLAMALEPVFNQCNFCSTTFTCRGVWLFTEIKSR